MPLLRRPAIAAVALMSSAASPADAPGPGVSPPAPAPKVVESYVFYDVAGVSVPTLWAQIAAAGPRHGGAQWVAHARWDVHWTFDWRAVAQGCRIERASTSLSVAYTLPRWAGRAAADTTLQAKWDRFVEALRTHEAGHGANGLRAAIRLEAALRELSPLATCEALVEAAEATARRIIDEETTNDRAYDAATEHGARQGVALR